MAFQTVFPRKSKNSPFFATTRDEGELDYILPRGKVGNGASRAVPTDKAECRLWVQKGDDRRKAPQRARRADSGPLPLASRSPRDSARGTLNFDLPAELHDPVRGNAEELGRIQGEVVQEDEQPIPPCQKNE